MRLFLTWLMVLGIVTGMNSRVLTSDGGCVVCVETTGHCFKDDAFSAQKDTKAPINDKCPGGDHHHPGCCSHIMPLALTEKTDRHMILPGSLLLRNRHDSDTLPEDPFLGSEKPPLI